jgi:hypothetical protein
MSRSSFQWDWYYEKHNLDLLGSDLIDEYELGAPIWYNCLGNITSVENGLWWIAHRARWVKVVWEDPVSSRKCILTYLLTLGCEVGIKTNNRWKFAIITRLY